MRKLIVILFGFLSLSLVGCNSTKMANNTSMSGSEVIKQEKILNAINNNDKLIEFYKQQLKKEESVEYRIKLANAYIEAMDAESALFVMRPLLDKPRMSYEGALVVAKAYLELVDYDQARKSLNTAKFLQPKSGEVHNLLGIVYVNLGDLDKARNMFEKSREYFYDDVKVKNNLALLDTIEGDYYSALNRITSLTQEQLKDQQINSNLILIMAKNSHKQYVLDALSSDISEYQKELIYSALRKTNYQRLAKSGDGVAVVSTSESTVKEKPLAIANNESETDQLRSEIEQYKESNLQLSLTTGSSGDESQ
ncbi:tetratricopeptide repeat protein [Vibrio ponticus]|uniref:tetratricopeptide repeat protein n=1 Tax=Vibrio ponticus TaxID=265668 RepID=UPI0011152851|nr:secretion protein [Vibrio ponticus]